ETPRNAEKRLEKSRREETRADEMREEGEETRTPPLPPGEGHAPDGAIMCVGVADDLAPASTNHGAVEGEAPDGAEPDEPSPIASVDAHSPTPHSAAPPPPRRGWQGIVFQQFRDAYPLPTDQGATFDLFKQVCRSAADFNAIMAGLEAWK